MGNENGEWILRGLPEDDPRCIRTPEALSDYILQVGFLPLFANEVPGFSVEERVPCGDWWSGNEADPWEWRMRIAREGRIAYGKFFDRKAGFISLAWLPYFVNFRRDGYDFDARWEEGLAFFRQKKIMDCVESGERLLTCDIKRQAGFVKGGEKNFEGTLTDLEMQLYLCVRDFRCRLNKMGEPYGWHIAEPAAPEQIWGYDTVCAAYGERPEQSARRIWEQMDALFPAGDERAKARLLGGKRP